MALKERLTAFLWKSSSGIALISALGTMLGLFAAVFSSRNDRDRAAYQLEQAAESRKLVVQQREQVAQILEELADLRMTNAAVMKSLVEVRHSGKPISFSNLDPADRQAIDEIKTSESKLDARLSTLETAIMASPEKAVALPMMKQQLDALQDRTHSDLDGIRGEIGRLFTLTQWFIGLMFTIALGMFGLSFNLRKAASQPEASSAKPA